VIAHYGKAVPREAGAQVPGERLRISRVQG